MKISILCPTRQRPFNIERLVNSVIDTAEIFANIKFLFYIDDDDNSYKSLISKIPNSKWFCGQRIIMSEMTNILAREAEDGILFLAGDDIVFESKNWDTEVKDEFSKVNDKILLIYGRDGIQNEKLATHSFIHKNWIRILGYAVPPIFTGDWADNWMMSLANTIGRIKYLENLSIKHMHPTAGLSNYDQVYIEKYLRDRQSRPDVFLESRKELFNSNVEKLRKFINEAT